MNRRGLLAAAGGGTVAALAAFSWPGWLRKAFVEHEPTAGGPAPSASSPDQGAPCPAGIRKDPAEATREPRPLPQSAAQILEEARTQAVAEKKKILVFVIPAGDDWRPSYERGHALGEFLNHACDDDLAPLAAAVVVCVHMEDLKTAFGSAPAGQPLMVLVDPAARPASLRPLDAALPPLPDSPDKLDGVKDHEKEIIDARIATVAKLVHQGLGTTPAAEAGERAGVVRQGLVKKRPAGAQWASSMGCGVDYEEGPMDNSGSVDCGMGHVPERSSRFLSFLVNKAR
jgi:hypothetical protein